MASNKEREIRRLLERFDDEFRIAFETYVETVQSDAVMAQILDALRQGNQTAALSIINSHINTLANVVPRVFQIAAAAAVEESTPLVMPILGISFDPTNPRAAAIMRAERLAFIADFSSKQVETVREVLAVGFDVGQGPINVARDVRASIGLTPRLQTAVNNYRNILEGDSGNIRDALTRDLRDRRFDRSIRAAAEGRKVLTPQEIDRMVDRYRERALQYRAETIARTESTRVNSLAREEAFLQTIEQTGISTDLVRRTWLAIDDKRTRDAHEFMDDQVRRIGEPFEDGDGNLLRFPGDPDAPPETTINCRCALTMTIVTPNAS